MGNVVADLHEPNDTVSEATPLVAGEKAEGILATASDTGFFVFEAEAGLWALELDGPAEARLDLALVDGAGEVLQEGGTWLVAPLSVAGPYWVRVSGSGAYRVGVRPLGAPAAVITAGGSIADGLAAAAPGDTILVLGGTYSETDRKSTRLNSSHSQQSRMPSSA